MWRMEARGDTLTGSGALREGKQWEGILGSLIPSPNLPFDMYQLRVGEYLQRKEMAVRRQHS